MSSNLAIPYARHESRGNISPGVEQDGIGRRANVTCLGCGEPLEHRRSSRDGKRRAHYAHRRESQADIARCLESAVHFMMKDSLATLRGSLTLPNWHGTRMSFTPVHGDTEVSVPTLRGTQRYADVVLTNSIGQQLALEVWYADRKEAEVVEDYKRARLPALELPVSDDDHDISSDGLRILLRDRAEWIVEPFEPFGCDKPPYSQLLLSHLRSRISHEAMERRGFEQNNQVWERRQSGLIARITDVHSYSESVTFEIVNEGEWRLIVEADWDYPEQALDPGARLFKQVESNQKLLHNGPRIVDWKQHYKPTMNEKGNWTSTTAVPGLRITVFKDWTWRYCIAADGYQVYSEREFDSPVKARRPAELWARVFREVVCPPDSRRRRQSVSDGPVGITPAKRAELDVLAAMSDDDIDTSDIPEVREFSNPRRGVFSGSPNIRAVPGRLTTPSESPDLLRESR